MELIFYKAKGGWLDWLIRMRTWGRYSHVELRFEDHLIFSSSWRDRGVRFRDVPIKPKSWDRLVVDITPSMAQHILKWCSERQAIKYDWLGCLGLGFGKRIDDENRWYCSEICAAALRRVADFPRNLSPSKLYELALKQPGIFRYTSNTFDRTIPNEYVADAREIALDMLSLSQDDHYLEMLLLKKRNRIMYEIVAGKIRQIKDSSGAVGS